MASTGTLLVRVFTSDAEIPAADAAVLITRQAPDGPEELLALRLTDERGLAGPLALDAPDAPDEFSDEPCPFAEANVTVDAPDFRRAVVLEVPIYPGVQTVQPIRLVPLEEFPVRRDETDVFAPPARYL